SRMRCRHAPSESCARPARAGLRPSCRSRRVPKGARRATRQSRVGETALGRSANARLRASASGGSARAASPQAPSSESRPADASHAPAPNAAPRARPVRLFSTASLSNAIRRAAAYQLLQEFDGDVNLLLGHVEAGREREDVLVVAADV